MLALWVVLGITVLAGVLRLRSLPSSPDPAPQAVLAAAEIPQPDDAELGAAREQVIQENPSSTSLVPVVQPPASAETRQLVQGLVRFFPAVSLSQEQAADWKQGLQRLVQQGANAVPAIREFLEQNQDIQFGITNAQALGYQSMYSAMIDALRQIGGPEATALMAQMLASASAPQVIAQLARGLDETANGQYRDQVLAVARQALGTASSGNVSGTDVAPLFEVFQFYGNSEVVPDLEKAAAQWKYYAVIALANLPDGAGVQSLMRMASDDPKAAGVAQGASLEMLAQLAGQNSTAREFLRGLASAGQIPASVWPYLTSPLAGDQYFPVDSAITSYPALQSWSDLRKTHIASGNQNFYTLPGESVLSGEGIQQRMALINDLLSVTSDPVAVQALQKAKGTLEARLARLGQSSGHPQTSK